MFRFLVIYRRLRKDLRGTRISRSDTRVIAWDFYLALPTREWNARVLRERTRAREAQWAAIKKEIVLELLRDEIAREDQAFGVAV